MVEEARLAPKESLWEKRVPQKGIVGSAQGIPSGESHPLRSKPFLTS